METSDSPETKGTEATAEWIEATTVAEVEENGRKMVDFGERKQVGIFKLEDGFHAIGIWCSHQKVSLMAGEILEDQIMCPLHGALFDLRTGKNMSLPAVRPIPSYELKVEDGKNFH